MLVFDNSFVEMVMAFVFILSSSIMFLAFALAALRSSRGPREAKAITVNPSPKPNPAPLEMKVFPVEEKIKELTQAPRTIRLEIEFPELPEKITVPLEKLPELLRVLGNEKHVGAPSDERGHQPRREATTHGEEAPGKRSWSALRRHDNPLLDILEKVSGLEFSEDGERVYCPRHGWIHYIVTSSGEILCGEGHEILWSPNKPVIDKKELLELQKDLMKIHSEIEELRKQALMEHEYREEERLEESEEGEEEYGEEEEEEREETH